MVKHGCKFVELDRGKVEGMIELLVLEYYHDEDEAGSWRVVLYSATYRGCDGGYVVFHLPVEYVRKKPLPCPCLSHLLKSASEEDGYYSYYYIVPIRIPVEHLEERLRANGFSLQSLAKRYVEFVVMLEKGWTNPLRDIEAVGLNVWYEDLYGMPMPEDIKVAGG